jgi:hypothetical protein
VDDLRGGIPWRVAAGIRNAGTGARETCKRRKGRAERLGMEEGDFKEGRASGWDRKEERHAANERWARKIQGALREAFAGWFRRRR